MRLPGFLSPLPKDKTKREADIVEDESKADPTAQPLMVSGTDLRTGPSSLKNPKSGGGYYGRIKSVFRKKQIHTDVLPSLNSVAEGLCDILEHCDETAWYRHPMDSFLLRVKRLEELVNVPAPDGEVREEERRAVLKRKLDEVPQDPIPLAGLIEDIREAMMDYQTSLRKDIYDEDWRLVADADRSLLNRMGHTVDAMRRPGDRQGCMKGTRRDILLRLEEWLEDEQARRVFWLNGLPEYGKSAIAQTFADICFADGTLGASFFCSRESDDRSNAQLILHTLAFQLAYRYPQFREELLKLLRTNPDAGQESLDSQMEKMIVGPFEATQIRTLIIIDALDECKDQEPYSAILVVLSKYAERIPNIRFFIAARPWEGGIFNAFLLPSLYSMREVLTLYATGCFSVEDDIMLFLRVRLAEVARLSYTSVLPENWPDPFDIAVLRSRTYGHFSYASAFVNFIGDEWGHPPSRLDYVISPRRDHWKNISEVDLLELLMREFCAPR